MKDGYFCGRNKLWSKSIIWNGYRYRLDATLKSGDISWPCAKSIPRCKARIRTDASCSTIISQKNEHSYPQDEQAMERHQIISGAKKKTAEDMCIRPSKKAQKGYFSFCSNVHFYAAQTSIFFPSNVLSICSNVLRRKKKKKKKKNQNVLIGTLAFTTLRAISGDNKLVIFFPENWLWHFMQIVSQGDNLQTCMMSKTIFWEK